MFHYSLLSYRQVLAEIVEVDCHDLKARKFTKSEGRRSLLSGQLRLPLCFWE